MVASVVGTLGLYVMMAFWLEVGSMAERLVVTNSMLTKQVAHKTFNKAVCTQFMVLSIDDETLLSSI